MILPPHLPANQQPQILTAPINVPQMRLAEPAVEIEEKEAPKLTAFATMLTLTALQEKRMLDQAFTRLAETMDEMGREPDGTVRHGSFMEIRQRNELTYEKNLKWREQLENTVFTKSNFTLGTNQRYARLISARVRNDLFGTKPFFGAMTQPGGDAELTKQVEEFTQKRIGASNLTDTLREGVKAALVRNEAIIKTTYFTDETQYFAPATVAVDQSGFPILTPARGMYVHERDDFFADPYVEGMGRHKADPSFQAQPGSLNFQYIPRLAQKIVHYDNVHCDVLNPFDFICPLKKRYTWEADINAHLYETRPEQLRGAYGDTDVAARYFQRHSGMTGATQPKLSQGEDDERQSAVLNSVLVAEVYMRFDADEDGHEEEIMLVLDMNSKEAIFYDYTGNHMSRRPFDVIPGLERSLGRWYGVGVFSKMEHSQLYIDAQFNRINEKDSQNNSLTFYDPRAVKEWKAGERPQPGSRKIYEVEAGYDGTNRPPAFRVNLNADAELGMECMNLMQQNSDQEFAVISSRDASASGLNASNTATGVMSVERDANVVTTDTEMEHIMSVERILDLAVELVIENMAEMEMEFNEDGSKLSSLNKEEVRSLDRDVRLLLTRTRSAEMLATNEKGEAIWLRYMQLDPWKQHVGRPLYIQQLKGLEIDDADNLLPEVTLEQAKAWQQQQAEAAKAAAAAEASKAAGANAAKPPSESINYKDAPDPIKRQMEAQAGMEPLTPEQEAVEEAKVALQKAEENAAKAKAAAPKPAPGGKPPAGPGE